jgi:hypothetical protein
LGDRRRPALVREVAEEFADFGGGRVQATDPFFDTGH